MLGAIVGDIVGSVHEGRSPGLKDFPLFTSRSSFTDDTVLTIAVASAILDGVKDGSEYGPSIRHWGQRYPTAGYGNRFYEWLTGPDTGPYNSYGNGAAMRVAPVGWAFDDTDALTHAVLTALVTHNHPEGIKGAQAVAGAVFCARTGFTKEQIAELITTRFGYDLSLPVHALRSRGGVGVTCQETIPAAVTAFLASTDFEDAIRIAVSLGGDTDTTACVTGAIAEAFYGGIPEWIGLEAIRRLDGPLFKVFDRFWKRYCRRGPLFEAVPTLPAKGD